MELRHTIEVNGETYIWCKKHQKWEYEDVREAEIAWKAKHPEDDDIPTIMWP